MAACYSNTCAAHRARGALGPIPAIPTIDAGTITKSGLDTLRARIEAEYQARNAHSRIHLLTKNLAYSNIKLADDVDFDELRVVVNDMIGGPGSEPAPNVDSQLAMSSDAALSGNVITKGFVTDIIGKLNSLRADCICNGDCGANAWCSCHGHCNNCSNY